MCLEPVKVISPHMLSQICHGERAVPERLMVSMAVMAAMAVDAPRGDEMLDGATRCLTAIPYVT